MYIQIKKNKDLYITILSTTENIKYYLLYDLIGYKIYFINHYLKILKKLKFFYNYLYNIIMDNLTIPK